MSNANAGPPRQPPKQKLITLSRDVFEAFKPARVFKNTPQGSEEGTEQSSLQISSIAFDDAGERAVTAGDDDVFILFDARRGKKLKTLYSKKYGISHARFTHKSTNIIHASTKNDHALRYHSMHDNKYLAYFQGHTATVRSLQMNPNDDTFISAGDDGTVRLWDLRMQACKGVVNDVGGSTIAAFDSSGCVFAVACTQNQTVLLFDASTSDDAPFAHKPLIDHELAKISSPPPTPHFTSISFSNNGHYLLIGTDRDTHYILDAFELHIVRRLEGHVGLGRMSGEELSWSADSNYVLSGSADGSVIVWDLTPPKGETKLEAVRGRPPATLTPTITLRPPGEGDISPARAVAFSPRYSLLGVGGQEFSMWLSEGATQVEEGW
ncbi:hypothetical protein CcaverHIS002_0705120 [Cutaneotrichosporon cavernicola]|uniref:WD40 repeat-like protein n=1 Tax=Cutaneotrichosporon cavernicola TaxID=279322 RepID=A0AA48QYU6_9TREE|nr:uncharacterized protein CcaverHIS019_0705180 [Cutaneotrichosporon cavernicola]BEI87166.1 hypothetical protein CcaverHIS002_0705120 [Cutaneotrichosporon cavernicola]BEI94937.1 hypothetical protein CcaverHIS019_0705180 [Cutaneotrichosporon cavernicola]BEJ02711.1 hypothetical protein CcaverHIS631_0705060 [Cutaneotrichosporon cavernicola]BEJ10465.1 hypothetical protein CcaverHIS641_0705000 [Cutaneotrichosporon cavernicola]